MSQVIVDTGPLVALFDRRDRFHAFTQRAFKGVRTAITCEAVIAEAAFLLRQSAEAQVALQSLIQIGALRLPFRLEAEISAVSALRAKYQDIPMSLADACLVRLFELTPESIVFTLDSDFLLYRAHQRKHIKTLMPARRGR